MLYKSAWVRICVICTYKKLSNLFITYFEILNAQYSVLYKPPQFKHTCIDPEKLLSLSTYAIGSMKKIVRVQLRATGPAREGVSGLSGFQRQRHSRGGKQARTFLFYSQRQRHSGGSRQARTFYSTANVNDIQGVAGRRELFILQAVTINKQGVAGRRKLFILQPLTINKQGVAGRRELFILQPATTFRG